MSLNVNWSASSEASRCVLSGELDLSTEPRVKRALTQILQERPERLVIDLADVTFIDSTGLRALLSARNRAATTGTRIVLGNVSSSVERTLDVANLTSFFEFEVSAEAG